MSQLDMKSALLLFDEGECFSPAQRFCELDLFNAPIVHERPDRRVVQFTNTFTGDVA